MKAIWNWIVSLFSKHEKDWNSLSEEEANELRNFAQAE
jgi:hypothetical protein